MDDKLDVFRRELIDVRGVLLFGSIAEEWSQMESFEVQPDDLLVTTYPKYGKIFSFICTVSFWTTWVWIARSLSFMLFIQYTVNHLYLQVLHPQIQPTSDRKFVSIEDWLYSSFFIILYKRQEHPQILEFVGS